LDIRASDDSKRSRPRARSINADVATEIGVQARLHSETLCERRGERGPDRRRRLRYRIEVIACQSHDDAVTDCSHGRCSRTAGKKCDLADRRSLRDFRDRFVMPIDLDGKSAGYDDMQCVGDFALPDDAVAMPHRHGLQPLLERT
jgi:hypothetical protein